MNRSRTSTVHIRAYYFLNCVRWGSGVRGHVAPLALGEELKTISKNKGSHLTDMSSKSPINTCALFLKLLLKIVKR